MEKHFREKFPKIEKTITDYLDSAVLDVEEIPIIADHLEAIQENIFRKILAEGYVEALSMGNLEVELRMNSRGLVSLAAKFTEK